MTSQSLDTSATISGTSIVFERKASFPDLLNKYGIVLDGMELGVIGKGKTQFSVKPGQHVLLLKQHTLTTKGPLSSREINFTISEGEQVSFFVKNAYGSWWKMFLVGMLPYFYYYYCDPNGWIIVERKG